MCMGPPSTQTGQQVTAVANVPVGLAISLSAVRSSSSPHKYTSTVAVDCRLTRELRAEARASLLSLGDGARDIPL